MKPFKIAVMYGSQTGNAQSIAEGVHDGCQKRGLESTLLKCDAWKKMNPELKEWGALVLIVSTTGNGDPPENSERFWRFIKRRTQPEDLLAGLPFALLGLGDTNYDKFCYMGKSFDKRLKELGAAPFHAPAFADEATNMEETIEPWLTGLFFSLESLRDRGGANNAEEKPLQATAEGGLEDASQAAQTSGVANGQTSPSGVDTTGRGEEGNGEQAAATSAKTVGSSAAGAGTVTESRSAPALATTPPTNGSGGGPSGAARDSTAAAETKAPPTPQQPSTAAAAAATAATGDAGGEVLSEAAAGGGGSKAVVAPGGSEPLPTHRIAVMYGSQTGNAKSIAEGIHDGCKERGLVSTLLGCDGWKKMSPELKEWSALVLIVSTTGNGDAPENTERFWRFLKRRTQPKDLLQGLPFALLGLGDTNYDKFCYMGKSLDKRLRELGAAPFHPPAFADEATNMEETIEPWLASLYLALRASILGAAGGVNAAAGAGAEGAAAAAATAVPTKAANGSPAPAAAAAAAAGSEDAVKEAIKGAAAEAFQLPPDTAAAARSTARNVAGTNGGDGGNACDSTANNVSGLNGAAAVSARAAAVTVAAAASPPAALEAAAAGLADLSLSDDGAATAAVSSVVEPGAVPTPPGEQSSGIDNNNSNTTNNNTNIKNNNGNSNGNSGGDGDPSPVGRPPPQQPWSPRSESGARPLPDFLAPEHLEPGYSPARSDLPRARPGAADVRFHVSSAAPEVGEAEEDQPWLRRARQRSSSVESRHTLDWPFSARVKSARYLTEGGRGANRRVINMELSLRGSGITYVPGDVIGFRCPNRAADTAYLLDRLQCTLPEGAGPDVPFQHSLRSLPSPCTLRDALSTRLELQAPLRRPVLRALAEFCGNPAERSWMELLCSKTAGAGVYASYVAAQSLTLCELLEAFPSCKPRPGALLALLPPLPPRYYSVASSQLATPDSVTVAFSVASSRLPHAPATAAGDAGGGAAAAAASLAGGGGGAADDIGDGDGGGVVTRRGLCTNWLEGILAPFLEGSGSGEGETSVSVPVFLKPTKEFLLPASAKWPCVLIGPGTGVSPFIGFLTHREEQQARRREEADAVCSGYWRGGYEISLEGEDDETAAYRGREGRGDMWLFFGCRNESQDWIFRREMEGFLERGTLSKLSTAFSRDASEKVYVQHRIREHGAELSRLMLQQGAYVYVCGDGNAMAQGVHRALVEALVEHGGAGVEGEKKAEAMLRMMKDKKRYVLDVWS